MLAERGVLFAPDFLVNAGGVIAVGAEYAGRGTLRRRARPGSGRGPSARRCSTCCAGPQAGGTTPLVAAERLAEERIAAAPPREPFAAPGA